MQLNHLDLQVSDVIATVDFFERLFGLQLQSSRTSPAIAILSDGRDFVLVLQRHSDPVYPAGFHLGFLVEDVDTVLDFHQRARGAGFAVSEVDVNSRGTMVYCRAPDGYAVEVSCRKSRPGAPR
ncbi:MAG: VOC family protein [Polyangiaceae bacterium]|nr:VOC family protein [Polyangiaceae bacterium]